MQAAQAVDKALQDTRQEGNAMEVDGEGEERRLSAVWPRYQLAKEAILNGFYAPARRWVHIRARGGECVSSLYIMQNALSLVEGWDISRKGSDNRSFVLPPGRWRAWRRRRIACACGCAACVWCARRRPERPCALRKGCYSPAAPMPTSSTSWGPLTPPTRRPPRASGSRRGTHIRDSKLMGRHHMFGSVVDCMEPG